LESSNHLDLLLVLLRESPIPGKAAARHRMVASQVCPQLPCYSFQLPWDPESAVWRTSTLRRNKPVPYL